jgi:hypothetical protein
MRTLFIDYYQFDSSKISDVREYEYKGMKLGNLTYSYTDKLKAPLLFKTEFIDLAGDPFKFMSSDTKKFISIDPNNASVSDLYRPLRELAKFTSDHVSKMTNGKPMRETGPILSNFHSSEVNNKTDALDTTAKMKNLKLFFNERNDHITSTIYNYNISKRYQAIEEYTDCKLSDIARFVTKNKQVRFILEPRIWWNKANGSYGTKLFIKYMEVRYKDQPIKSKFDEKQTIISERITSIEI